MDTAIWVAVITVGGAILAALVTALVKRRDHLELAEGGIDFPSHYMTVESEIPCAGWAKKIKPDIHLWLAVQINNLIWPKAGGILLNEKGRWEVRILEEGDPDEFSIVLYAVTSDADREIRKRLEGQRLSEDYAGLTRVTGMRRLAGVQGLHLAK